MHEINHEGLRQMITAGELDNVYSLLTQLQGDLDAGLAILRQGGLLELLIQRLEKDIARINNTQTAQIKTLNRRAFLWGMGATGLASGARVLNDVHQDRIRGEKTDFGKEAVAFATPLAIATTLMAIMQIAQSRAKDTEHSKQLKEMVTRLKRIQELTGGQKSL